MNLEYTLKTGAAVINDAQVAQVVVAYVNAFDPREIIDVSDITTRVRNAMPSIDTLYPFTIGYQLLAPDGTTIDYQTSDRVIMHESKLVDTGIVRSAEELLRMGVSDRTTRYVTNADRVEVTRRTS